MAKKLLAEHEACLQSSDLERVAQFFLVRGYPRPRPARHPLRVHVLWLVNGRRARIVHD